MHTRPTSLFTRAKRFIALIFWLIQTTWLLARLRPEHSAAAQEAIKKVSWRLLRVLNVRLNVQGDIATQTVLVTGNHISWLDIFALNAVLPSSFIAKQEIRRWPLIGKLAANIGTTFIDRTSRKDTNSIVLAVNQSLANGQSVCFFPEAQTSDGMSVLPFKAALFQSAIDTDTPIAAFALRYYDADGKRSSQPSYVGDTSLFESLWQILAMQSIEIRVDFLNLQTALGDRFETANQIQQQIALIVASDSSVLASNPNA